MSVPTELLRVARLATSVGRAGLHHLFPDEFEYYACALELVDYKGNTVLYLLFPVMPDNISIGGQQLVSVVKTAGGIVSTGSATFAPKEISLSGTFGRKLRLCVTQGFVDVGNAYVSGNLSSLEAIKASTGRDVLRSIAKATGQITSTFSYSVKTGYGASKILESIINQAQNTDSAGRPYMLFFYNLAFNANYLVEPLGLTFTQDRASSNMMWNYQLALKAVAPSKAFRGQDDKASIVKLLTADNVQKGLNMLLRTANEHRQLARTKLLYKGAQPTAGRGLLGKVTGRR